MQGLTILDKDDRGILAVTLKDLLALIGPEGKSSRWRVSDVWAEGDGWNELELLDQEADLVDGARLYELAERVLQVIDGTFAAFKCGSPTPWLIISAVDSSFFDVQTDRRDVLDRLRASYEHVNELPQ